MVNVIKDYAYLNLSSQVKQKLSIYFNSIVNGNTNVYRSPIGQDLSPGQILKGFDSIYNSSIGVNSINDVLNNLELSNRAKFGPLSIAAKWVDRKDSVYSYFANDKNVNTDLKIKVNLQRRSDAHKLRPISYSNAIKYLKNDTNSGLPYLSRKSLVKQSLLNDISRISKFNYPCILFTRTQESGKTRNVWGYPIFDTLNEMRYYVPLLEYQKKLPWRSSVVGPDEVDSSITKIIDKSIQSGNLLVSIDFIGFDSSVKSVLQRNAFDYIKMLFQQQFSDDIELIFKRFNQIGLLCPDGIITGSHGIPSGSTFTNEVDSIVQYLVASNFDDLDVYDFQIQGDDGVYLISEDKVDKLLGSFVSNGLKVNFSKSYRSKYYCVFLQKLFHVDYRNEQTKIINGIYPVYRALNRIIFQERWANFQDYGISGRDYYSIRTISILENCRYNPNFKELVKYILKLDKYSLKFSDNGLAKYIEMMAKSSGSEGILINQYGDNVKGIKSFETFKLIKELS